MAVTRQASDESQDTRRSRRQTRNPPNNSSKSSKPTTSTTSSTPSRTRSSRISKMDKEATVTIVPLATAQLKSTETRAEINRRMLESGDLARLETELLALLQSAGWTEHLGNSCVRKLRDPKDPATNFAELLKAMNKTAHNTVPKEVKAEIIARIRDVVKSMVAQ